MTDPVVTQADRDAVQAFHGEMARRLLSDIKSGTSLLDAKGMDSDPIYQAFAQHRTQAFLEGERAGMEKAYRSSAEMCRQMAGTIGALPGSSIYAALEACAERMDEIAIRDTGATK